MKKVYLLLHNNSQTGPYTINELLQLQVNPFDLIWAEGSGRAWFYASELPELKTYFEENKKDEQTAATTQPGGWPANGDIEQWAEELKQRALSTPRVYIPPALKEETVHVEVLRALAQERIEFIDHRKKQSPAFEWMSAAMVMLVVVASVYAGAKIFNTKTNLSFVADKAVSIDNHAAKDVATPQPQSLPQPALYNEIKKDTSVPPVVAKQKPVIVPKRKKINPEALPATAIKRTQVPSHEQESASSSATIAPEEPKRELLIEPEPRAIVTGEPVEKKKTGLFKGLFRKKKKNEEKAAEQYMKEAQHQSN
jgi:hypothetical protein